MQIKANQKMLLLRYSNYKKYNFIDEHRKILAEEGTVWMLKIGKNIPEYKLKEIYAEGGLLILRSPKADGSKYYAIEVTSCFNGEPDFEMIFPEYYETMLDDEDMWTMDSLQGTWFKVTSIKELPEEVSSHFSLLSNGKMIEDVLNSTRSSMIYIKSDIDF